MTLGSIVDTNRRLAEQNKSVGRFHHQRRGVDSVSREKHLGWNIEIGRRGVGVTLRRDVYSATIRDRDGNHEHFLNGFATATAAVIAAKKKIDVLVERNRNELARHAVSDRHRANTPTGQ